MNSTWKAPSHTSPASQTPTPTSTPTFDEDLAATRRTPLILVATIGSLVAGVLAAAVGLQLMVEITFYARWLLPVPYFMSALGIAAAIVSVQLYRMKLWAAIATTALSAGVTLFAGGWALFALTNGLVSLYGFLAPMLALGSTVCAAFSVPVCRRAKQALERLAADA